MALPKDVLKRRIHAARLMRDLDQEQLNKLFEADGLGKTDAGRIERGKMTMGTAHREAFVRNLQVPEDWFTEPESAVDELVGWGSADDSMDWMLHQIRKRRAHLKLSPEEQHASASKEFRELYESDPAFAKYFDETVERGRRAAASQRTAGDIDPPGDVRLELEAELPSEEGPGQEGVPRGRPAEGGSA